MVHGSREKEEAPLDDFFVLCAPRIGVIPPERYQEMMGWQLGRPIGDDDIELTRVFTLNLDNFPDYFTSTTLSVQDLVSHCISMGYVNPERSGRGRESQWDTYDGRPAD